MRLDKFLKLSRIIKRRTVANKFCTAQKISVNGKIAKAATTVKIDDIIQIDLGKQTLQIKVLKIIENANKKNFQDMYQTI